MEAELQESEVLWPEYSHNNHINNRGFCIKKVDGNHHRRTIPVSIPEKKGRRGFDSSEEEEEEDEKMVVPPHEMVARRTNGKMAFSVCTGNGRTLKGRDLSKVRNSVLRMTGFLESC